MNTKVIKEITEQAGITLKHRKKVTLNDDSRKPSFVLLFASVRP